MSEAPDLPPRRAPTDPFRWEGVPFLPYKEEGSAPFKAVSRQVLFHHPALAGELRYFEVEAGGHTTLERHEHAHGVMILRGAGRALVHPIVQTVGPHDLIFIPPWTWHQFRAGAEPLGFLCLVNVDRDRPTLPGPEDWAALRADPAVAAFLDGGPV
ncbi:cupin domain-containing protein [Pararhodospirillum oryzae]|uniref:Cupin n=1 Tax=Pararhodospirillum oryzae TaxID=478448 RepID=A0A512H7E6_9PROT|nr:cupin domain-containing protein [Pararhodospirillum oryzae]GEO81376.1 cupin [Pararhodospirillum oryzae]